MQRTSRNQGRASTQTIWETQGSPVEGGSVESGPARSGSDFGGAVTDNATSQIRAKSDYRLAGHNDVRFNV